MKDYKLKEIKPRIFFMDFKDPYNMAMHFMRYQEYYESASSRFRDKSWTWIDFMEWYSKKYGDGAFTYAIDWSGFNIPGHIIRDVIEKKIPDPNKYDAEMFKIFSHCAEKYSDEKFYIIGAVGHSFAMKHEIAHGLFYTQPSYKKEMTRLVKSLKSDLRKSIFKSLKDIGYTPRVYVDECQAYLSTGFTDNFDVAIIDEHKPFIQTYETYYSKT
jgi:hypothetical protein